MANSSSRAKRMGYAQFRWMPVPARPLLLHFDLYHDFFDYFDSNFRCRIMKHEVFYMDFHGFPTQKEVVKRALGHRGCPGLVGAKWLNMPSSSRFRLLGSTVTTSLPSARRQIS